MSTHIATANQVLALLRQLPPREQLQVLSKALPALQKELPVHLRPQVPAWPVAWPDNKQLDEELQSGTTGLVLFDLTGEAADAIQVPRSQVPDLPDRVVVATALHLGLSVISRDHKIQFSNIRSIW
jgi:hypothetical protein